MIVIKTGSCVILDFRLGSSEIADILAHSVPLRAVLSVLQALYICYLRILIVCVCVSSLQSHEDAEQAQRGVVRGCW